MAHSNGVVINSDAHLDQEKKADYYDPDEKVRMVPRPRASVDSTYLKRERMDRDDDVAEEGDDRQRKAQRLGRRTQDPKTFGPIPGVEVGRWWASRCVELILQSHNVCLIIASLLCPLTPEWSALPTLFTALPLRV